jgi:hypothetical protein
MSVKETRIMVGERGDNVILSIKFAYQFLERDDLSSLLGKTTYIFITTFSKQGINQFAFGSARNHKEFLQALRQDAGGEIIDKQENHGQIHININKEISLVKFHYSGGENDKGNMEQIGLLFNAISHESLDSQGVRVRYGGGAQYVYDPDSKGIIKLADWIS